MTEKATAVFQALAYRWAVVCRKQSGTVFCIVDRMTPVVYDTLVEAEQKRAEWEQHGRGLAPRRVGVYEVWPVTDEDLAGFRNNAFYRIQKHDD